MVEYFTDLGPRMNNFILFLQALASFIFAFFRWVMTPITTFLPFVRLAVSASDKWSSQNIKKIVWMHTRQEIIRHCSHGYILISKWLCYMIFGPVDTTRWRHRFRMHPLHLWSIAAQNKDESETKHSFRVAISWVGEWLVRLVAVESTILWTSNEDLIKLMWCLHTSSPVSRTFSLSRDCFVPPIKDYSESLTSIRADTIASYFPEKKAGILSLPTLLREPLYCLNCLLSTTWPMLFGGHNDSFNIFHLPTGWKPSSISSSGG